MSSREDEAIMARFAADYLALLDQRVVAIQVHLKAGSDLTAHVAMLSLESTSAMAGADELARAVGALRAAHDRRDESAYAALSAAMVAAAGRVPDQLRNARDYPVIEDEPGAVDHA